MISKLAELSDAINKVVELSSDINNKIHLEVREKAPLIIHQTFVSEFMRLMSENPTEIPANVPEALKVLTAIEVLEELYPELRKY